MENIVTLKASTEDGSACYFMTWGRIQDTVDATELEAIVLDVSLAFATPGKIVEVKLCGSLHEAALSQFFYECFFDFCQKRIPFGESYASWRSDMDSEMRAGKQIALLGPPE